MARVRLAVAALLAALVVAGCSVPAARAPAPQVAEKAPSVEVPEEPISEQIVEEPPPVVEQMPEPVEPAPEPVMAEPPTDRFDAVSSSAGRFRVLHHPAALNVPLKSMPVTDGVVNPPTHEDAYLIEGYGTPHGEGTTYVAMHSGRGLPEAAGSALIDTETGEATLDGGELLFVDGVTFRVSEVRVLGKGSVAGEEDLWQQVDGRLVVFTCIPLDSGPGVNHVVVVIADQIDWEEL